MNEHIKELAEQALHWAHGDSLSQNPKASPSALYDQKFAELIIKKCSDIATAAVEVDGQPDHPGEEILKYFGDSDERTN